MKIVGILALCASTLGAGGCLKSSTSNNAAPPSPTLDYPGSNVVLISIDTLRADHLGLYGYPRPTSPFLDDLATEGIVFEQFLINGGFTLPSHMTMMTSLKPTVHGVRPRQNELLPDARTTLAEVFAAAGYQTAAFVDAGWMRGQFGFTQGFDVYDDEGGRFAKILPKAYRWLDVHHEEPFFLFLHTFDVHSQWRGLPYECPAPYPKRYSRAYDVDFDGCREGKCASRLFKWIVNETRAGRLTPTDVVSEEEVEFSAALYDGCINYVDDKIAELVQALREHDVLDNTVLVITSDHGEEFLDHGMLLHSQNGYEELSHVPLIIRLPDGGRGGLRVPHLAAMIDLMPTILDLVDLSSTDEAQGHSLVSAILGDEPVRRDTTIWDAIRTEDWKMIPREEELFDLDNDPLEQTNLWAERTDVVRRLSARQRRHAASDQRLVDILSETSGNAIGQVELDAETLEELRALGYLD